MAIQKTFDISFNIVLPIIIGCLIYAFAPKGQIGVFSKNYFPDGLWAYSFCSSILIIWERKLNPKWIFITVIVFIVFEVLQFKHIIKGTGDFFDLITYLIFGYIALLLNKYFSFIFISKSKIKSI